MREQRQEACFLYGGAHTSEATLGVLSCEFEDVFLQNIKA